MTADLETAVRSMLRERANDIDTLPADFTELASLDVLDLDARRGFQPRRHRTAWLVAAAVAAVLAVVGTAVAVGSRSRHGQVTPATHSPTITPTAAPTIRRSACSAVLPQAWTSAATAVNYGALSSTPLAISPDGSAILVARDFGSARDVALIKGSAPPRSIYSVPQPDLNQVLNASLDDTFAAIDLDRSARKSNGVIPAADRVLLVTLSSGSVIELDHAPFVTTGTGEQGRTIDGSLLWNGHVYWDVRKTYTDRTPTIEDYDIATRRTTVAGTGGGWIPRLLAGGVTFDPQGSNSIAVPRAIPKPVAAATAGRRSFLQTDGRAFGWTTASGQLAWWAPGQPAITVFAAAKSVEQSDLQAVAGDFLIYADQVGEHQRLFVLDARSGAKAMLPASLAAFLWSADGVGLGYSFVGGLKDSPTAVARLDTRQLPELRC